jgi:murein endopeptidase
MIHRKRLRRSLLAGAAVVLTSFAALAAETTQGIEQALNAAMQSKRGITVYVNGQAIGGAVVRVEPGAFVELRNQEFGRILLQWERIDGIAIP